MRLASVQGGTHAGPTVYWLRQKVEAGAAADRALKRGDTGLHPL